MYRSRKIWCKCIIGLSIVFLMYIIFMNNNILLNQRTSQQDDKPVVNMKQPFSSVKSSTQESEDALHSFLTSTARDLLNHTPPTYLKGYRNPCFRVPFTLLKKVSNMSSEYPAHISPDESCIFCLPSVFHIGVSKTASSDFHKRVCTHQDMFKIRMKEPSFFSSKAHTPHHPTFHHNNWTYTVINYVTVLKISALHFKYAIKNYTSVFNYSTIRDDLPGQEDYGKFMLVSDSTPFYAASLLQSVPRKIKHFVPNAKIIYSVRDPVERMLSEIDYLVQQHKGILTKLHLTNTSTVGPVLHKRILHVVNAYKACKLDYSEETCAHSYTDVYKYGYNSFMHHISRAFRHGLYHLQLKKYLYHFPKENILLVDMHEYAVDPMKYIDDNVLPFLGLRPYNVTIRKKLSEEPPFNKNTEVKFGFLEETKLWLAAEYKEMSEQFSAMLGGKQFTWYQKPMWKNILNISCSNGQ